MIARNSQFENLPYYEFANLIKNPYIRSEIVGALPNDPKATRAEMDHWLALSEKDQYLAYVDKKKTFAQLKSSISARKFNLHYTVLDDLIADLLPEFKGENLKKGNPYLQLFDSQNLTKEQLQRKLEPHETNKHCMRSIHHKPKS